MWKIDGIEVREHSELRNQFILVASYVNIDGDKVHEQPVSRQTYPSREQAERICARLQARLTVEGAREA